MVITLPEEMLPASEQNPHVLHRIPEPIKGINRIQSIDALRGFALLGILTVNIQSFAMVSGAFWSPIAIGDGNLLNLWIWIVTRVLAGAKFMTIFSLLFGAGVVLMTSRVEAVSVRPAVIHYRRMAILVLFGVAHAYLLWSGDVLVAYGVCGAVVFFCRKLRPGTLLLLAFLFISCGSILFWSYASQSAWLLRELLAIGRELLGIHPFISPSAEILAYRSGWLTQLGIREQSAVDNEIFMFAVVVFWRVSGLMLAGMALMKLGFLNGLHKALAYWWALGVGFCAGIPLTLFGMYIHFGKGWNSVQGALIDYCVNYWASLFVSLGWIGLLLLLFRIRVLESFTRGLAALGRMALTNYLLQTIICTTIFYGHGFGLFERVDRIGQSAIVFSIWTLQLVASSLWLRRFQFGPTEWLWRKLTYMRREPFVRTSEAA